MEEVKTVGRPDMKLLIVGTNNCERTSDKTVDYLALEQWRGEGEGRIASSEPHFSTNVGQ